MRHPNQKGGSCTEVSWLGRLCWRVACRGDQKRALVCNWFAWRATDPHTGPTCLLVAGCINVWSLSVTRSLSNTSPSGIFLSGYTKRVLTKQLWVSSILQNPCIVHWANAAYWWEGLHLDPRVKSSKTLQCWRSAQKTCFSNSLCGPQFRFHCNSQWVTWVYCQQTLAWWKYVIC